ncbi:MAG: GDP-L-fucose synthase [Pirellulales bacterium]|nr:GDP-L-fucose synthase [Pirellulales bacterium]
MPTSLDDKARIYVSGHAGLVGSAVVRRLEAAGFQNILTATRSEVDLRDPQAVKNWFASNKPDYVVHVAGKVGGIRANLDAPVDFLHDNLMIQATVLRAAWRHGVEKLLYLGSSCIYPRECPQPMSEEHLLSSPFDPSNEGYALAKLTGVKACQYYRKQYGCNFIAALPTNLYGQKDNFDPRHSHVLPALVRRFHQAKLAGEKKVVVWGTGQSRREFLHVDDLADACLFLLEKYEAPLPLNLGTGEDVSIAELAELVKEVVYPHAELAFDSSKPEGPPRKLLDVTRLHDLGWRHQIDLKIGIQSTYEWFLEHVPR